MPGAMTVFVAVMIVPATLMQTCSPWIPVIHSAILTSFSVSQNVKI